MSILKSSATLLRRNVENKSLRGRWERVFVQSVLRQHSTETEQLTVSHVRGPTDIPIVLQPFGQVLEEASGRHSDQILVHSVEQQVKLTYGEALRKADRLAAGLLSLGLKRGDRVALWAPNSWQWIISSFALIRSGLVTVAVNPSLRGEDAIHSLVLTRPAAIIAPAEHNGFKYHDFVLQIAPELRDSKPGFAKCAKMPTLRAAIAIDERVPEFTVGINQLAASASEPDVAEIKSMQKDFGPDDTVLFLFSSGTTGRPKAVVIRQKGFVNNGKSIGETLPITDRSKPLTYCAQVPLFHAFGVMGVISLSVQLGAKIILPSMSYSPQANLQALKEEKCNIVCGTPTMFLDLIRQSERDGRPSHEADVGITGGGPLVPQLGKDIMEVLKMKRIHVMYGMSEATGTVFQSSPNDTLEQLCHTVGRIKHNVEAKVVDPNGKTVPVNTPGELWIRGYLTMKEYFGQPEKTKECVTEDGWVRTGDQFVIDEKGYARIIGRFKDIIIRGGENINPKDIEDVITTHPSVMDAQVVGVRDDRLGEECCVCLILKKPITGREIYDFCKDKISKFKIPRYYVIMNEYPRTASGKIQKHKLRDTCNTLLNEGKLHKCFDNAKQYGASV